MTAWQDQPPLSRRQARQNERGESVDTLLGPSTPEYPQPVPQSPAAQSPAAQQPAPQQSHQDIPATGGRRAQQSYPQQSGTAAYGAPQPEPLTYSTQGRPQVPSYDGPSFRSRSGSAVPSQQELPSTEALDVQRPYAVGQPPAAQEQQGYRVRDFSPEGRRSAFSSTAPAEAWTPPATDPSGLLDYHTQAGRPQAAPAPVEPTPSVEQRTMSRRELRALHAPAEQQEVQQPPAQQQPVQQQPVRERVRESPEAARPFTDALAEFEALTRAGQPQAPVTPPPLVEPRRNQTAPTPFDQLFGGLATDQTPAPAAPAQQQPFVEQPPVAAWPPAQEAPRPAQQPAPSFDAFIEPAPTTAYTPPVGHWSTQADIDDDEQFQENTLSRNIAATSGAITTSALVLPSMPRVDDILSPLGSTGEILVTGSINLPRSLSTIGSHPERYDHSDVDTFLESGDREDSDPDSAPVRAIRAVSTHTGSNGIIATKKRRSNNALPTILAVSAAVMAVGVVVLFVVGFVFKGL